ncbi:secretin N-terminal domain-containing protein [Noviherbaspirillum massiliense]|uniref:secretin N-terminal domain-containing protein n=1 Tax=Noviherbaspirillum massiliense TaxID=1465823 RepID=UPI00036D03DA|nr:secretin N-terminal domain-containing protein [Noviherbaspirillum massiliense]
MASMLLLSGCAGEWAYRRGKQLVEEGKVEEGLVQLERAVKVSPDDLNYKSYYYRQRESQINMLLTNADAARLGGQHDSAELLYRRVLTINPENERAKAGLEATRAARKHKVLLEEAEALFRQGNVEGAQANVRAVLVENSRHPHARDLLRRIEEKNAKDQAVSSTLKTGLKTPISLEFRDVALKAVFEILSRTANINFVLDKDVRPDLKTTIFVKNTPIEDVVQFLLVTNQLEKKTLSDNSLLIYPNTPAKAKDYQELVVRSFYLANADVKQTVSMIKTLAKTKDIFVDEKLNMFVMRDTPEVVKLAEKLVAMQDLAEPEVTLAVEVLEVSTGTLSELGIRYPNQLAYSVAGAAGVPGQLTLNEFKNRSADLVRMTLSDPLLVANLRAQDSDSNLLANPRIRVKNREKAKIHIGDRVPVITSTSTSTGFVSESVNYLDVGLKLDVEPNVYLEGEVAIKIGLEVSNIVSEITSKSGTLTYRVGTRNASTTLRLKDGETQILAGLISDEERNSMDKVPGLGDLPLLGRLFSNKKGTKNKTEIVLLVTPYIVRNVDQPDATVSEFMSGTESTIGAAPLRLKQAEKAAPPAKASNSPAAPAQSVQPAATTVTPSAGTAPSATGQADVQAPATAAASLPPPPPPPSVPALAPAPVPAPVVTAPAPTAAPAMPGSPQPPQAQPVATQPKT